MDAYWAGLFDGDGSVYLGPTGQLGCYLTSQDKHILNQVVVEFGGQYYRKTRAYQWQVKGIIAANFLERIIPYLRIKQLEARLALQCWTGRHLYQRDLGEAMFRLIHYHLLHFIRWQRKQTFYRDVEET